MASHPMVSAKLEFFIARVSLFTAISAPLMYFILCLSLIRSSSFSVHFAALTPVSSTFEALKSAMKSAL